MNGIGRNQEEEQGTEQVKDIKERVWEIHNNVEKERNDFQTKKRIK